MAEVNLKGGPVNGLVRYVRQELSPAQQSVVMEALPQEHRGLFDGELLAHQHVPLPAVTAYIDAAARAKGDVPEQFAHRAGRHTATLGVNTVYKFIMMVLSPQAVLKKAPFMWSRVFDAGEMSVETSGRGARITVTDFPAHPITCARITGWFEVVAEHAGAQGLVTRHAECAARGDSTCAWELSWRAWGD